MFFIFVMNHHALIMIIMGLVIMPQKRVLIHPNSPNMTGDKPGRVVRGFAKRIGEGVWRSKACIDHACTQPPVRMTRFKIRNTKIYAGTYTQNSCEGVECRNHTALPYIHASMCCI